MKNLILSFLIFISTCAPAIAHETYKALIIDVYDADTFTAVFTLPFKIQYTDKIRLDGIDTPEIRTLNDNEKALALEARDFVRELILGKEVDVRIIKQEKFGRYLAEVILPDGKSLNQLLIEKNYAREYHGERREEWDL